MNHATFLENIHKVILVFDILALYLAVGLAAFKLLNRRMYDLFNLEKKILTSNVFREFLINLK